MADKFLSVKEAAATLGISRRTLLNYLKKPGGPVFYRLDKKILIREVDLNTWMERRKVDLDAIVARALDEFI